MRFTLAHSPLIAAAVAIWPLHGLYKVVVVVLVSLAAKRLLPWLKRRLDGPVTPASHRTAPRVMIAAVFAVLALLCVASLVDAVHLHLHRKERHACPARSLRGCPGTAVDTQLEHNTTACPQPPTVVSAMNDTERAALRLRTTPDDDHCVLFDMPPRATKFELISDCPLHEWRCHIRVKPFPPSECAPGAHHGRRLLGDSAAAAAAGDPGDDDDEVTCQCCRASFLDNVAYVVATVAALTTAMNFWHRGRREHDGVDRATTA
jgi:hypothetical protein